MHGAKRNESQDHNKREIEFIEETHTYLVDGVIRPSVTQIMATVSKEYFSRINEAVLNTARDRGSRIHKAIENYELYGEIPDAPETREYLTSYKIAKKIEKFEVEEIEMKLTNGVFCGTVDQIVVFKRIHPETKKEQTIAGLQDIKATAKINKELAELQLAGYDKLLRANGMRVDLHTILQIKKNGYKLEITEPNYELWEQVEREYFMKHDPEMYADEYEGLEPSQWQADHGHI